MKMCLKLLCRGTIVNLKKEMKVNTRRASQPKNQYLFFISLRFNIYIDVCIYIYDTRWTKSQMFYIRQAAQKKKTEAIKDK